MARFHVTDDIAVFEDAVEVNERAELDPFRISRADDHQLATYQKRAVENRNFLERDDGYIAVVGTLICDGKLGHDALERVHTLYTERSVRELRDRCFGHYAVVIKRGQTITVFTDPNGVFDVYYVDSDFWFVSNSLYVAARVLDERTLDRDRLVQKAIEITELSTNTMFEEVARLHGSEKLEVDLETHSLTVESAPTPPHTWEYSGESFDGIVSDYSKRQTKVFSQISTASDKIGVQATGGIDSRTVLGGLLATGSEPTLLYGVGNSVLTNTKDRDLEIAARYAQRYELPFHRMDWSGDYPLSEADWADGLKKYGFRYKVYGGTPNFFASLANGLPSTVELVLSGYGFGTVSNIYFWEQKTVPPISFDRVVAEYFTHATDFGRTAMTCFDEYVETLESDARSYMQHDPDEIDIRSDLDLFEFSKTVQLLNGRSQSAYTNIANEFTFHLAPLATYELSRPMLEFPPRYREGERIRVELLEDLYPDLLEVDLFSGIAEASIGNDGRVTTERSIPERVADRLPTRLVEYLEPLYDAYFRGPTTDVDEAIYDRDVDVIEGYPPIDECFDLDAYTGDMRNVSRLALLAFAIEELGDDARTCSS